MRTYCGVRALGWGAIHRPQNARKGNPPMSQATQPLLSAVDTGDLGTIKGWFNPSDRHLFEFLLGEQVRHEHRGELVEVGCFLGKSAVLVGHFRQPGETFTVLDLFEGEADDAENTRELTASYNGLTRSAFEANYLRFHSDLPTVVQATSDHIVQHVAPGSARFVHIDASHLYEHVTTDIDSARLLLQPDGIVAFDDYRFRTHPGRVCRRMGGRRHQGPAGHRSHRVQALWHVG